MDMVLRSVAMYALVWLVFRLSGRRTMAQLTTFDFVLLLIFGEAAQQALLGEDFTFTNAAVVILTLMVLDDLCTSLRARSQRIEHVMDGSPILIMENGKPLEDRLKKERVDIGDILHAARQSHGIARLDQIRHAILEPSGGISIIPEDKKNS